MSISGRRHSRPVVCTTGLGAPLLEPSHHLSRGKVDPESLLHQGEPEDLVLAAHEQVRHRLHAGRTRPRWHGPGVEGPVDTVPRVAEEDNVPPEAHRAGGTHVRLVGAKRGEKW